MYISQWAAKHNISPEALADLQTMLFNDVLPQTVRPAGMSERAGQQRIRIEAPKHRVRLFRNNVGACEDAEGNFIRYGLANESKAMNEKVKSHDLVGITPVIITPQMVGGFLGVFTSIECKRPGWSYRGTAREVAQLNWAQIIISMGGIAQFATCPEDIW